MKKALTAVVISGLGLVAAGCSSIPPALRVESACPGAFWEVVSVEWSRVRGQFDGKPGEAVVTAVGMEHRGWGTLMPWCWFVDRSCHQYSVGWTLRPSDGTEIRGARAVHYWKPVSGALSEPAVVSRRLMSGDGDDSWAMPICDAERVSRARDVLTAWETAAIASGGS